MRTAFASSRLFLLFFGSLLAAGTVSVAQQGPIGAPQHRDQSGRWWRSHNERSGVSDECFPDGDRHAGRWLPGNVRGAVERSAWRVATDAFGNVWVLDTDNLALRKIDARSGIITLVAGKGTACSTKTDSNGDGCPAANTIFSGSGTGGSGPRGIGSDPWGNIFIAGYGDSLVHVVCNAVSPLCPNTAGTHQLGYMYAVAGCVTSTGSSGTGGAGADGGIALPTGTLQHVRRRAEPDARRGCGHVRQCVHRRYGEPALQGGGWSCKLEWRGEPSCRGDCDQPGVQLGDGGKRRRGISIRSLAEARHRLRERRATPARRRRRPIRWAMAARTT